MVNRLLVVINTAIYFNVLGNLLHCTAYAVLVFEDRSVCGPFVVKMSARPAAVKLLSPTWVSPAVKAHFIHRRTMAGPRRGIYVP